MIFVIANIYPLFKTPFSTICAIMLRVIKMCNRYDKEGATEWET